MKSYWITTVLVGFVATTGFRMLFVPAAEVQRVQLGSTVTLLCNVSYLYDTTWLKHNPDLTPTVILCTSLREGQPFQRFQLSPRYSVSLMNRSLALRITGVEERDLGLYYCIANVNTRLMVGRGMVLQGQDFPLPHFHHWYCVAVGVVLLVMVLAVCLAHCKAKSEKKTTNETPR